MLFVGTENTDSWGARKGHHSVLSSEHFDGSFIETHHRC
jgi:hypothetical protein